MQAHADLVKEILGAGHEIGNHMTTDERSARLSATQSVGKIDTSTAVIEDFVGKRLEPTSRWYRLRMVVYCRCASSLLG